MRSLILTILSLIFSIALSAQPKTGVVYHVKTPDGKLLTVENGSTEHNAYIVAADQSETLAQAQVWALYNATGDGVIMTLFNPYTMMGVDQALKTSNKQILTWEMEASNSNQRFIVEEADGGYLLTNESGRALEVLANGYTKMSNAGTVLTFEETTPSDLPPYPGMAVRLTCKALNQCVGTGEQSANDTPLVMEDIDESRAGQVWTLKAVDAQAGTYILANALGGTAMDMALGSTKPCLLWSASTTSDNQKVSFVAAADGQYQIQAFKANTYFVTAQGASQGLRMLLDTGSEMALWTLTPAEAPQVTRDDWQNEYVYGIGKLGGHATYMPYRNTAALKADAERLQRAWIEPVGADYLSLNGTWKFKYSATTGDRPTDYMQEGYDVSSWDDIKVPGCIEMQGYDRPMYVNQDYPFEDNPPFINITASNTGKSPVGSYRRNFTLPAGWDARRTLLHFSGIYSGAYVWVNGQQVGYTQGGNMDAEFDITDYVRTGENSLSVQVIRWTDGSYLEGQDMFHVSGIHRDVYLVSVPQTYIADHYITSKLSAESNYTSGTMTVQLTPSAEGAGKQYNVTLLDADGKQVWSSGLTTETTVTAELSNLHTWTAATPYLYKVIISQTGDSGEEMAFATPYGFRDLSFDTKLIYINGVREYFKGANTQDTHPVNSHAMDVQTMWRDLTMMKQANLNCVRASHYPRDPKMNAMMDYLGIYLVDEADVECHKNWSDGGNIRSAASWRGAIVDRVERMVMRDRNHTCVTMWSLGNESGNGANFGHAYNAVRALDPRPIHYEGATRDWSNSNPWTDVRSQMYPSMDKVNTNTQEWMATQPYFMCEYAHAMGNAIGNLTDYWDVIIDSPNGIGGCIWDWVNQSIYEPADIASGDTIAANGYPKFKSGYDFPGPHQGNFLNNGILEADRAWSSKLAHVKAVYQWVEFSDFDADTRTLQLTNNRTHATLDEYTLATILLKNGEVISETTQDMPTGLQPGESQSVTISYPALPEDGAEYTLQLEARLKEPTTWAEAGYPMATAEFMLREREEMAEAAEPSDVAFNITSASNSNTTAIGNNIVFEMDGEGQIKRLTIAGNKVISSADNSPVFSEYRWIENDGNGNNQSGNTAYNVSNSINSNKNHLTATVDVTNSKVAHTLTYDVYADGTVDLHASFTPQVSDLRRIGLRMNLDPAYTNVEYYARGPWENYIDRAAGCYLNRVNTTIDNMYVAYAHPQSNGDHRDLRELRLINDETCDTLLITTQGDVSFSLSPYDETVYSRYALHPADLVRANYIQAHFDTHIRGIGNGSCGQNTGTLGKYCIPSSGTYEYTLRFQVRKYNPTGDGVSTLKAKDLAEVTFADGIVTASPETNMRAYDLGGNTVAIGKGTLSLKGQPHGVYLVKANGRLYKFVK